MKYTPTSHPRIFIPLRPRFQVRDVVFNDAHMCISLEGGSIVSAFHAKTGRLMTNLQGHTAPVACMDLGENVCVTGSKDHTVNVYYAECDHSNVEELANSLPTLPLPNIEPKVIRGHTDTVTHVKVLENGWVVSGSQDTSVRLARDNNQGQFDSMPLPHGHTQAVSVLRADTKMVASGSTDKTVRVWDCRSQKQLYVLKGHAAAIKDIALDSINMRLISSDNNHMVKIWDLKDGSLQHTLSGQTEFMLDKMGAELTSVGSNGCLFVWDVSSAELLKIISHHTLLQGGAKVIATDEKTIITASDAGIFIWDRETEEPLGEISSGAKKMWVGKAHGRTIVSACQYDTSAGVEAHFLSS